MTQRAIRFEADLDISDVTRGLNRIEQQARRAGSTVGRVGGGLGRAGGGIGRTVGAGAGIGAGLAVFEQLIERIFELFEDTPVMEQFITALDGIFTAAGPLIGVLLESLTPILLALTPAIEPLARALVPLVELFGAGLLIAVQLITPAIILFAEGLEKVTTFIKNTVLIAFQFVVDQLNKLPFVDIQVELGKTGDSFDAMAVQIANAGDAADMATGQTDVFADATDNFTVAAKTGMTATEQWGFSIDRGRAALHLATGQTDVFALSSRASALEVSLLTDAISDNVGAARVLIPEISELTTQYIAENRAATDLITPLAILADEMDEAYTASDRLGVIIGGTAMPTDTLADAIDAMTTRINDAQTAADLNAAAFAALSPELMAAAIALGIFRQEVAGVGGAAGGGGGGGGNGGGGGGGNAGNAGNSDGSRKGGLDADEVERGLRNKPVGAWIRDRYSGGYWIKTREPRGSNDRSGTGYPRWARHVRTLPSAGGTGGGGGSGGGVPEQGGGVNYAQGSNFSGTGTGRGISNVTVEIDGETVATATNRSESEGGG